mgnify:CR=1 FL=1
MRSIPLTVVQGGIQRLRTKGGASPESLYDLVNGYITAARTIRVRPGTIRHATLPAGTKGLCAHHGMLHVFSHESVEVPEGFVLHVLAHPESPDENGDPIPLSAVHFAAPFMGFLYVVAEFQGGDVYHYWLQSGGPWQPNRVYRHGEIVEPTTPNGLAYQATRLGAANPSWAPNVPRQVGDRVEPTTYNDFFYEVVETFGSAPRSGTTEPDWPTQEGARVFEDVDGIQDATPTVTQPPTTPQPDPTVRDRYRRGQEEP